MTTKVIDTSALAERPTVYNSTQYNVVEIDLPNVATAVASGAGQTVVLDVVFASLTAYPAIYPSDTNYSIFPTPSQACSVSYSAKTTAGFRLTLTPLTSGVTLAAGTCDILVKFPNGGQQ